MNIRSHRHRLPHGAGLPCPLRHRGRGRHGSAGRRAGPLIILPGGRSLVPTGLAIALPPGYELQIRPRSGLALKQGILVPNSPGTIDEDYRGELQVILMNAGDTPFTVDAACGSPRRCSAPWSAPHGTRRISLPATARGAGGFGSTGRAPDTAAWAPIGHGENDMKRQSPPR